MSHVVAVQIKILIMKFLIKKMDFNLRPLIHIIMLQAVAIYFKN